MSDQHLEGQVRRLDVQDGDTLVFTPHPGQCLSRAQVEHIGALLRAEAARMGAAIGVLVCDGGELSVLRACPAKAEVRTVVEDALAAAAHARREVMARASGDRLLGARIDAVARRRGLR